MKLTCSLVTALTISLTTLSLQSMETKESKKDYLTVNQIAYLCSTVCNQIKNDPTFSDPKNLHIIFPTRGMLLPMDFIKKELGVNKITSIAIGSYDDQKQGAIKLLLPFHPEDIKEENILVIDDLIDSGETMKFIADLLEGLGKYIKTAALIDKKKSDIKLDYCPLTAAKDTWIVFPWEEDKSGIENPLKDECSQLCKCIKNDTTFKPELVIGCSSDSLKALAYVTSDAMLNIRKVITVATEYDQEKKEIRLPSSFHPEDFKDYKNILLVNSGYGIENCVWMSLTDGIQKTEMKVLHNSHILSAMLLQRNINS